MTDRHAELLAEVRATTAAIDEARARQLAAIRAARAERVPVDEVAVAAGYAGRDGLHRYLRRADADSQRISEEH